MTNKKANKALTKKGISGAFWQTSASLIRILTQFILLGILARLISPTDFGYVAFIMILVRFTDVFSKMGIGGALIQLNDISKSHIKSGFTLSLTFGIILATIFYVLSPIIASFFKMEEIIDGLHFYAFLFPIRALNSVSMALLRKDLKYALIEKINLFSFIFGYALVAIILALLDYGYWALLYGQLALVLINTCCSWYHHFPKISIKWRKEEINQLLSFGSGYTINTLLAFFSDTIDNLMISKFLGPQPLGLYSKAYQLYAIPSGLLGQVYKNIMFPILSKRKSDLEKLKDFYFFSVSLNILILTPVAIIVCINSKLIISTVLGPGWEEATILLQILSLSLPARFGFRINRSFFDSMGLVFKSTLFEILFLGCILVLCGLGFIIFELPGVALGVLLASIIFFFSAFLNLSERLGLSAVLNKNLLLNFLLYFLPILTGSVCLIYFLKPHYWIIFTFSIILVPIFIAILFYNKNSVILTESNIIIFNQIFNNLPLKAQNIFKNIKIKINRIASKFKLN